MGGNFQSRRIDGGRRELPNRAGRQSLLTTGDGSALFGKLEAATRLSSPALQIYPFQSEIKICHARLVYGEESLWFGKITDWNLALKTPFGLRRADHRWRATFAGDNDVV